MMTSSSSPSAAAGTPSKSKLSTTNNTNNNNHSSRWKTIRWILLGFGIGAATTAMFHSVHMPTIRVELEYGDAPLLKYKHHSKHNQKSKLASRNLDMDDTAQQDDQLADEQEEEGHEIGAMKRRQEQEGDDDDDEAKADETEEEEDEEEEAKEKDDDTNNEEEEALSDVKSVPDTASSAEGDKLPLAVEEEDEELPDFSNPGPPPELEPDEAFAACILIKDDNHWLIEWLAYHYHVMPLRYLIVAIDPSSRTSPIPILKRYKDRKLINIGIWSDDMFMPTKINANPKSFDNNTDLMMHRVRQNNFYFKCMKTFKQRNREWLMLIDTDEYIVTNYASGLYYNLTKNIPITRPGSVLTFIKQHHTLTGENHTCSYMPRYMFGIKETAPEMVNRHIPSGAGFNGFDFLTQRFMYRNPRRMHNGKNLINIRKLPAIKTYTSVHHVSSYCPDPDKMRTVNHVKKSLVRVHHYLGTEEQYFFRTDPRGAKIKNVTQPPLDESAADAAAAVPLNKSKTITAAYFTRGKGRYEMLNKRANYPDQGARAWIRGFIANVGLETAKELLHGVGQVGYEGTEQELAKQAAE